MPLLLRVNALQASCFPLWSHFLLLTRSTSTWNTCWPLLESTAKMSPLPQFPSGPFYPRVLLHAAHFPCPTYLFQALHILQILPWCCLFGEIFLPLSCWPGILPRALIAPCVSPPFLFYTILYLLFVFLNLSVNSKTRVGSSCFYFVSQL